MVYIVWYMNVGNDNSPEFELFGNKNDAIQTVSNLMGKYDRIGIASRQVEGGEEVG